jgi:hypothetical protein
MACVEIYRGPPIGGGTGGPQIMLTARVKAKTALPPPGKGLLYPQKRELSALKQALRWPPRGVYCFMGHKATLQGRNVMRKLGHLALVLAVVALTATAAQAQRQGRRGPPGGGGFGADPLSLLSQKSVQEELKITPDQTEKVTKLNEQRREAFRGSRDLSQEERQKKFEELAKETSKSLAEILRPEQDKRLKQISVQLRGPDAFGDPKVAESMKFTDEQKEKVKVLLEDYRKDRQALFQGGNQGNREENRKKMAEMRTATTEKLTALFTPEQKTTWKEMTGEPFKGQITPPQFGGRRGGRGGSQNNN